MSYLNLIVLLVICVLCFKLNLAIPSPIISESQWESNKNSKSESSLDIVGESSKETSKQTASETTILEKPSIPDKIVDAYDNIKAPPDDVIPILDTISEHEKYGNNGDLFGGISRSIVNGYEAFSNLLNFFIQQPKEVARSVSKGITAQLDAIGGKLVGL